MSIIFVYALFVFKNYHLMSTFHFAAMLKTMMVVVAVIGEDQAVVVHLCLIILEEDLLITHYLGSKCL